MTKTVIIGGGVSGITSAIFAKKRGEEVIVIERNEKILKKLLLTGNGRCNYFNEDFDIEHYHGNNVDIFSSLFTETCRNKLLEFFSDLGIVPLIINGYYYPYSNTAYAMYEALFCEVKKRGIEIVFNEKVFDITKEGDLFKVVTDNMLLTCDKVIVATGLKSFPKTGSDGNLCFLLERFGHKLVMLYPSLVKLKTNESFQKRWDGVRSFVRVSLYENDEFIKSEDGQIQFSKDGISGICVFNLSGYVNKGLYLNRKEKIKINFMPFLEDEPMTFFRERNRRLYKRSVFELLEGFLNYKIIGIILEKCKIKRDTSFDDLENEQVLTLIKNLTEFEIDIVEPSLFEISQVCGGGVSLEEINPKNMESNLIKNLYFSGEVMDIWGDCGGYNLSFAFLTGMISGSDIDD